MWEVSFLHWNPTVQTIKTLIDFFPLRLCSQRRTWSKNTFHWLKIHREDSEFIRDTSSVHRSAAAVRWRSLISSVITASCTTIMWPCDAQITYVHPHGHKRRAESCNAACDGRRVGLNFPFSRTKLSHDATRREADRFLLMSASQTDSVSSSCYSRWTCVCCNKTIFCCHVIHQAGFREQI